MFSFLITLRCINSVNCRIYMHFLSLVWLTVHRWRNCISDLAGHACKIRSYIRLVSVTLHYITFHCSWHIAASKALYLSNDGSVETPGDRGPVIGGVRGPGGCGLTASHPTQRFKFVQGVKTKDYETLSILSSLV